MPQLQLPIFPDGSENLSPEIAIVRKGDQVIYVAGQLPLFTHGTDDIASFRLFTSQLMDNGQVTQSQISRIFSIPLRSVKRYLKRFRDGGPRAFFVPPAKRQGHRLTEDRLKQIQQLLDQGNRVPQISRELSILPTTLHKAIDDGRLTFVKKKKR